ncbi:ABC transporter ATP-binding protein [Paenibacillus ehimensis]|uniref:ATP-binding cassette domain-containing protein n=1 Tax=Paenibacillus ehimensis TaxID=79264 RepID=A0ABT8V546_9BACL|nr:ATP-binding cassette domain-containing protein [Paenibacillus ehimensis]MDO3676570.1 ATP-binding cassette domain-containing protein [Paenibacillus ehimensis]MEC0208671.1 ATP-binding cassette domain-containing protein [Paenibacillus ehimensis]
MQPYLSIRQLSKSFGSFTALKQVNLDMNKNEFVCLLGPSGCGKTTLLRLIAGLESPTEGRIAVDGKDITALPPAKRNFGMVFQSYALFPNLTAYQNVAYGLQNKKWSKKDIDFKVREAFALIDLEHVMQRYPSQLSGGQQQRIALARAIVLSPDMLLLDEPLSALDAKVRVKLRQEIRELQTKLGITTIMVTHDQEEALTMADRIVVMNNAEVVQTGTPQDVYDRPNCPFVADFVGAVNFLEDGVWPAGKGGERRFAVRPEHIEVRAGDAGEGIPAVVRNVEFRGPFYRLNLQLLHAGADGLVTVDVPAQASRGLPLAKDARVLLNVPAEKLLSFRAEALAN